MDPALADPAPVDLAAVDPALVEQDYIFASNFFNNGPILINFILFESS